MYIFYTQNELGLFYEFHLLYEIHKIILTLKMLGVIICVHQGGISMNVSHQKQMYEFIEHDLKALEDPQSTLMQKIVESQNDISLQIEVAKYVFYENIEYYNKLISLAAVIVKEIGMDDNSISYSQVVENLIMRGYLSVGNTVYPYKELTDRSFDLYGFLGFDVIHRQGCCRHISSLHQDIFQKIGLFCQSYRCYDVQENDSLNPNRDPKFNFIRATHAANLIQYHNQYYIHDIFNQIFFYLMDGLSAEEYENGDDKLILYYTPISNMIFDRLSYKQLLVQIKQLHESSLKAHMDLAELLDITCETNDRFYNNSRLLHNFRKEAESYMKKIIPN